MKPEERARMDRLEEIAKWDIHYQVLMQELREIERKYNLVLHDLDYQQRKL